MQALITDCLLLIIVANNKNSTEEQPFTLQNECITYSSVNLLKVIVQGGPCLTLARLNYYS